MGSPILIAYLLPPGADSFRQYLDQWLELKANDGFRQAALDYWIRGRPRREEAALEPARCAVRRPALKKAPPGG